jgi:hypothetical protein
MDHAMRLARDGIVARVDLDSTIGRHRSGLLPALLTLLIAACASSGSTAGRAPEGPIEGNYEYFASLPGQQVRGRLRVIADTIVVDPAADYCRPVVGTPDPLVIRYTCNGPGRFESLSLTLDRRNPAQFSKWSATFRVQRSREVCVQYATQGGRQVCVRTQTEQYETTESSSGSLQVRRAIP